MAVQEINGELRLAACVRATLMGHPQWCQQKKGGVNMKRQRGEARKTRTTRLMMTEMLLCHLYYTRGC